MNMPKPFSYAKCLWKIVNKISIAAKQVADITNKDAVESVRDIKRQMSMTLSSLVFLLMELGSAVDFRQTMVSLLHYLLIPERW